MTLQQALNHAATLIARRDAQVLLGHLLSQDQAWMLAHSDQAISATTHEDFVALVARRAAHEPLQYITGTQEFYGMPFRVTRDTLIPRPETEHLVEAVLAWAASNIQQQPLRILDVGTGTGAIAIALAKHLPQAAVSACDLSTAALAIAQHNASENHVTVRFVESDLLQAYANEVATGLRFDAIVSNPPYIPTSDAAEMQPEVRDHEPHTALFAGEDGLNVYRRLLPEAHAALRVGGLLAMEIGFGQSEQIATLLLHWSEVRFIDDYAAIPRVVLATKTNLQPL